MLGNKSRSHRGTVGIVAGYELDDLGFEVIPVE
jgi:hypothetical protein